MDDVTITATRTQLIAALAEWERRAKAEAWPERDDAERHGDNADLLIELIRDAQA